MRTQSPWAPLTGYWEEDPTTVGWLAPSQTIWEQRIITQPGVQWTRAFTTTETRTVGVLSDNEFAVIEGNQLRAVDLADGSDRALLPEMESVRAALVHDKPHLMVVADRYGQISAFSLPLKTLRLPGQPIWGNQVYQPAAAGRWRACSPCGGRKWRLFGRRRSVVAAIG